MALADALERLLRRRGAVASGAPQRGARVRRRPHVGPRRRSARGGPARRAARARAARRPRPVPALAARRPTPRPGGRRARVRRRSRSRRPARVTDRCSRGSTPEDIAAVEAALDGRQRRRGSTPPTPATAARSRSPSASGTACPPCSRRPGLRPDEPPERRARDGPRPARRRRRATTTPTCSPRRSSASARRWTTSARRWTSAAPPGASVRVLAAAYAGRRVARRRPQRGRDRVGARAPARRSTFRTSPQDPPLDYRRRRVRPRLRDLDLVALRRGGGGALARRDASHRSPRRPARPHRRTGCSPLPTTRAPASARPRSSSRSAASSTGAGSGSRPSSAREGDWGVKHVEWGTAFLTPEWLAAPGAARRGRSSTYAVGQNAGNQDMFVLRRR